MASRSFKPASYLASAARDAPNRSPRQRPAFTRSSSGCSVNSTKSDDSVVSQIKGFGFEYPGKEDTSAGPSKPDTPRRKGSKPIAIEVPGRNLPKVYTPLSARGDLPGGYFPNHEQLPAAAGRTNPFSQNPKTSYPDSPTMSGTNSLAASPAGSPPKMPSHILTPNLLGPLSPSIPEPLLKPMGKYHPSNYKSPVNTTVSTPTSSSSRSMLPPTNLSIPPSLNTKRQNKSQRPGHERKSSDVTRKIQQYQRDMIAQAHMSAQSSMAGVAMGERSKKKEPVSPRLLPAGSPGPITPLELEMDGEDGYLVAGHRARGGNMTFNTEKMEQRRSPGTPV